MINILTYFTYFFAKAFKANPRHHGIFHPPTTSVYNSKKKKKKKKPLIFLIASKKIDSNLHVTPIHFQFPWLSFYNCKKYLFIID
jgi:hypothetical protein